MSVRQGGKTIAGSVGLYPLNEKNITNCPTNIPQDIKLELNNGTLTLKAGSKVYVPNGAGVFDEKTTTQDITISVSGSQTVMVCVRADIANGVDVIDVSRCYSGSTNPGQTYSFWYDTTSNLVKLFTEDTSTPARTESLPIAIVTISNGTLFSIDQIFNGFGYIGSTVFALPGVKGLIPDGRNADGSLKNIETEITNVQIRSGGGSDQKNITVGIRNDGTLWLNGNFMYLEQDNKNYDASSGNTFDACPFCVYDNTSGKISKFTPKRTFHAVDYNEADFVVSFQRPTLANNYTWYRKYKSGWVEQGGSSFNGTTKTLPVVMADTNYTVTTSFVANTSVNTMQWQYVGVTKSTTSISRNANGVDMSWYVAGIAA